VLPITRLRLSPLWDALSCGFRVKDRKWFPKMKPFQR